jgi:rubrerythrin
MSELGQLVRNAVAAEKAAASFYRSLAADTSEKEAHAFLMELAVEEDQHAEHIEAFGRALVAGELPARPDTDIDAIETSTAWRYAVNLTLHEALNIALDAEHGAALFYGVIADGLTGDARDFFQDLADTELEHASAISERLRA